MRATTPLPPTHPTFPPPHPDGARPARHPCSPLSSVCTPPASLAAPTVDLGRLHPPPPPGHALSSTPLLFAFLSPGYVPVFLAHPLRPSSPACAPHPLCRGGQQGRVDACSPRVDPQPSAIDVRWSLVGSRSCAHAPAAAWACACVGGAGLSVGVYRLERRTHAVCAAGVRGCLRSSPSAGGVPGGGRHSLWRCL